MFGQVGKGRQFRARRRDSIGWARLADTHNLSEFICSTGADFFGMDAKSRPLQSEVEALRVPEYKQISS